MARGRPRGFDRDEALGRATALFWEHGYEATAVSDLTRALGIAPPSLYAAFGSKRALFAEVVERYQVEEGAGVTDALAAGSDARSGVAAMLRAAARAYTAPEHPPGCLVITAAVNCGPGSAEVREDLRARRAANIAALAERIRADSGLPPGADPLALASFYGAVIQGMSQRARDGATRTDLESTAELAMAAWPT